MKRSWPALRFVIGLGLAWWALATINGHRGELNDAWGTLGHLHWQWAVVAFLAETVSFVAFAMVQVRLLRAGSARAGLGSMSAVTLASNSIANSIPLGPALAAVFAFRQYRRVGADDALAGWVVVATFVFTALSLAIVAAIGVGIAGSAGAGDDLVWVTVGVLGAAVAIATVFLHESMVARVVSATLRASRRLAGHPRGEIGARIDQVTRRFTAVHLDAPDAFRVGAWSFANWIFDCTCLGFAFTAIGAPVPWQALILAYGAGQLAANLPITPGGLGVVEGSLIIGLVAFGGSETSTVAAVLLYRIFQFWIPLPIGWVAWGGLTWRGRRSGPGDGSPTATTLSPLDPRIGAGPVAPGTDTIFHGVTEGAEGRAAGTKSFLPQRGPGLRTARPVVFRAGCALAVAAVLLGGCTSAHDSLGTGSSPCYLALPRAADAVHDGGHLAGVRLVSAAVLKSHPRLRIALERRSARAVTSVCLIAYRGSFDRGAVSHPLGATDHARYAIVALSAPGNRVLATLLLQRLPLRFRHTLIGS